jgi:hypothetical protein
MSEVKTTVETVSQRSRKGRFPVGQTTVSPEETSVLVDYLKQWNIGAGRHELVMPKLHFKDAPERSYNLKGKRPRKFLQHEHQTFGINLGWTDDAEPATARKVARWFFTRQGGQDQPVRYGDSVALGYGVPPSFIRYAHRDVGINLDWSNEPVFEWKLLGGKIGHPVRTDEWLAIYNERAEGDSGRGECLIFFDRTVGGDIGWPSSKTWGDQAIDVLVGKLKEAAAEFAVKALLAGIA